MFKTVVKFEDFNDNHKEETLYFNLNKPEMIKILKEKPDITSELEALANELSKEEVKDGVYVDFMSFLEDLIVASYGVKTEDGRFIKNAEKLELLQTSNAYEALYTKFMTDPKEFDAFISGIFPKDIMTEALKEQAKNKAEAQLETNK